MELGFVHMVVSLALLPEWAYQWKLYLWYDVYPIAYRRQDALEDKSPEGEAM